MAEVVQQYLSIQECALILGASEKFVRNAINTGALPSFRAPGTRLIRVREADLHDYMRPDNAAVVDARRRSLGGEVA